MKYLSIYFFALLILVIGACKQNEPSPMITNEEDTGPMQILFIGNSHTFYNDLPIMVKEIAASMKDTVEVSTFTAGGARFENHVNAGNLTFKIESEKWDYVVLQEAANYAAAPLEQLQADVLPYADIIVDNVKQNNAETQILFYLTHGYHNDWMWFDQLPNVDDFDSMLDITRSNYLLMQTRYDAQIAPAGVMWKILQNDLGNIELHDPDGLHPSELGSYVSACTIYVSMFGKALQDAYHPTSISDTLANQIFTTVNASVLENMPDWRTY